MQLQSLWSLEVEIVLRIGKEVMQTLNSRAKLLAKDVAFGKMAREELLVLVELTYRNGCNSGSQEGGLESRLRSRSHLENKMSVYTCVCKYILHCHTCLFEDLSNGGGGGVISCRHSNNLISQESILL